MIRASRSVADRFTFLLFAVITIDRVPGGGALHAQQTSRKAGARCLKMLRETVKVTIDAGDDGAAAAADRRAERLGIASNVAGHPPALRSSSSRLA